MTSKAGDELRLWIRSSSNNVAELFPEFRMTLKAGHEVSRGVRMGEGAGGELRKSIATPPERMGNLSLMLTLGLEPRPARD
jgi:hypothetical protein